VPGKKHTTLGILARNKFQPDRSAWERHVEIAES